jgi:hypothetical protein
MGDLPPVLIEGFGAADAVFDLENHTLEDERNRSAFSRFACLLLRRLP